MSPALCVGDQAFGDAGVVALAGGLKRNLALQRLDCENKGLGTVGAAALCELLAVHPALTHLHLARNALGDAGLAALLRLCSSSASASAAAAAAPASSPGWRLRHLDVRQAGPGAAGVQALAAAAPTALQHLSYLDLSSNSLGPQAGPALSALLMAAPALQELRLGSTALGDEGVLAPGGLQSGLLACSTLRSLDLSDCQLTGAGGGYRAGLLSLAGVPELVLAGNAGMADGTVAALVGCATPAEGGGSSTRESSERRPQLTSLDVSGTGADAAAIAALARVPGLQSLALFGCHFGERGAAALAAGIAAGGFAALRALTISGCALNLPAVQLILGALMEAQPDGSPRCPGLRSIEVGANAATQDDEMEGLVEALKAARPDVALHWRSAGDMEEQANG